MEKSIPIEDERLGILDKRDCIFLNSVSQDNKNNLILIGEINGLLAGKIKKDVWIPYKLTFHKVIAYFTCELDTYEYIDMFRYPGCTDFNIVENSRWLEQLPIRKDYDKSIYKHFQVYTYDYVYNIIAVSYKLDCDVP